MIRSIKKRTLEYYVDRLNENKPVKLARYGDGEIRTLIGKRYENTKNSNGCTFSPLLRGELRKTLFTPADYDYGILRVGLRSHRKEFNDFQEKQGINIQWVDGDVLLNDALAGRIFPLIEAFKERRILMVGQSFLRHLLQLNWFKWQAFVIPSPKNAINEKEWLLKMVKHQIEVYNIDLVLWSCGLAAKAFIYDIHNWNKELSQLDCGSMWDGFCGQQSRSYMRRGKVDWAALIEVNGGKRERRSKENFRI